MYTWSSLSAGISTTIYSFGLHFPDNGIEHFFFMYLRSVHSFAYFLIELLIPIFPIWIQVLTWNCQHWPPGLHYVPETEKTGGLSQASHWIHWEGWLLCHTLSWRPCWIIWPWLCPRDVPSTLHFTRASLPPCLIDQQSKLGLGSLQLFPTCPKKALSPCSLPVLPAMTHNSCICKILKAIAMKKKICW
jgi:hypothetical protein